MNKLIIGLIFLTGCATVSEYNKGCRDGINSVRVDGQSLQGDHETPEQFCNRLDQRHQSENRVDSQQSHR